MESPDICVLQDGARERCRPWLQTRRDRAFAKPLSGLPLLQTLGLSPSGRLLIAIFAAIWTGRKIKVLQTDPHRLLASRQNPVARTMLSAGECAVSTRDLTRGKAHFLES
jgi:hypothetical protein